MLRWWKEPAAGDIVWCHFPDSIHPHPKPRPALILAVFDDDAPQFTVQVAYGTSQRTTTLYRGEFAILRERNAAAYEAANLSFDTKFNLRQVLELPFSTDWFSVPPGAPHGQIPRLGTLHPSMVRTVQAASDRPWATIHNEAKGVTMRLTADQVHAIRQTAQRVLGAGARVSLFGSMALDQRKGGDIDLFFETDAALANRAKVLCQLSGALTLALGDRKIDIILKDANTPPAPIFDIAKRTGVPL